ncbi:adenylyl cyclase-associated protein 1-like isoform X4 [Tigriopus californicus]|uniref:adenylyl cyclase-associated protein 1-like isoform X4 n=2 Tax=Tigriopus californicus TaxID=6832 RepID=UPI0027D9D42C|nr:adenylyl cyclase-associated protein 1-like isoform X4 [Tigriopus californicus]
MLLCCSWKNDQEAVDDSQSVIIGEVFLDQTIGPKQEFEDEFQSSDKYCYNSQGSLSLLDVVAEEDDYNYKVDQSSLSSKREGKDSPSSLRSHLLEQDPKLKTDWTNLSDLAMAGSTNELASLIQRLEAVAIKLESAQGGTGAASAEDLSAHVSAFDDIVAGPFNSFLALSTKIGGDVASQGRMVSDALRAQREFLVIVSKSKLPGQNDLQKLLKPTSDKINEIQTYRESNRRSEFFNHLSAISESIPALGWVTVSPAPSPFVKEMNDAGQFYANRVLKDWKEKDKTHVEWTKAWSQALADLQAYVKQYHTTGLVWNAKGGNAMSLSGAGGSAATGPAGGPPLPPPPPPPGLFDDIKKDDGGSVNIARNALFDEINRGGEVTKGLKKVTADMQTHKNPNLRSNTEKPIPGKKPAGLGKPANAPTPPVTKPPKFELDGKKWIVEYFKNNPNIEIEQTETNQSVYVFRCEGSTIKVGGKCNNIILDGCKKTAIVFDNVVSSCEFINCQSVQMQVLGKVPTISVDKTDGCQMFLSKDSMDTEIITAKSTEMNVMIPNGDDFVEQPVPEQFKTKIQGTKLTTTISESV